MENENNKSTDNQTELNTNSDSNTSIITEFTERNDIENKSTKKESKKELKKESKKESYNSECENCLKNFKSKLLYEKHTIQQLCILQDKITYCKVCCLTVNNHNEYKKHLFTIEHLNNIGYNNIERLQTKEVSQVQQVGGGKYMFKLSLSNFSLL